nr:MAG TPA: hypothetical protein [Caudoviricetes sp.]
MATLKQLVDETTKIKNELKTCHTNLKNNLIDKGVECSNTDKLLSLANKVGEIELGKKWASGEHIVNFPSTFVYSVEIDLSNLPFTPSVVVCELKNIEAWNSTGGLTIKEPVLMNGKQISVTDTQHNITACSCSFHSKKIILSPTNRFMRVSTSLSAKIIWYAYE